MHVSLLSMQKWRFFNLNWDNVLKRLVFKLILNYNGQLESLKIKNYALKCHKIGMKGVLIG